MKVLLLAQVFPPRTGGSGRWLWELYRRLQSLDVHVVAAVCEGDRSFDEQAPLPITRIPLQFKSWGVCAPSGIAQYWRAYRPLARVADRVVPDIVHCGKCLPEGLLALALARRRGVPYVCFAHGEELRLAALSAELRWLTRQVLGNATQVIANSRFTRDVLAREWGVPADKLVVMHPGVDTSLFTPAPRDEAVRSALGWTGRRVVLTVGALQKRKGQDTMIRALPAIRAACPDILYVMAGEAWDRPYLEQLIDEHQVRDVVQFRTITADSDLVRCYQQCDLFALPNRQIGWDVEGFGIVLVEAQACGRPVLAGNSGGTVDTLQDGLTGEVVDATVPDNVAEAVIRLLTTPGRASSMGLRARAWAVERFDWSGLVPEALQIFGVPASSSSDPRVQVA